MRLFFIWLFSSSDLFPYVNCSSHAGFCPVFFRKHLPPGQSVNGLSAQSHLRYTRTEKQVDRRPRKNHSEAGPVRWVEKGKAGCGYSEHMPLSGRAAQGTRWYSNLLLKQPSGYPDAKALASKYYSHHFLKQDFFLTLDVFLYSINESLTFEVEGEKMVHKETAICLGITEQSQFPLEVKRNTKR